MDVNEKANAFDVMIEALKRGKLANENAVRLGDAPKQVKPLSLMAKKEVGHKRGKSIRWTLVFGGKTLRDATRELAAKGLNMAEARAIISGKAEAEGLRVNSRVKRLIRIGVANVYGDNRIPPVPITVGSVKKAGEVEKQEQFADVASVLAQVDDVGKELLLYTVLRRKAEQQLSKVELKYVELTKVLRERLKYVPKDDVNEDESEQDEDLA